MNFVNVFANNTRKKQQEPLLTYTGNMISGTYGSYKSYILDSSGTLTLGNNCIGKQIYVFAIAGGGGGGNSGSSGNGTGGNGGQIVGKSYTISSSGTYNVNIGANGIAATAGGNTSINTISGFDISFNAVGGVGGKSNTSSGTKNNLQSTDNAIGGYNTNSTTMIGNPGKQLFLDMSFSTIYYGGAGGAGSAAIGNPGNGGKDGGGKGGDGAVGKNGTNYGSGGGGAGMAAVKSGGTGFGGALFIFVPN